VVAQQFYRVIDLTVHDAYFAQLKALFWIIAWGGLLQPVTEALAGEACTGYVGIGNDT